MPSDAETTLIWWSSDNDVATVENGQVSVLSAGRCLITVKTDDGGIQISDFYVFYFGLGSDYEYRKDAFYADNKSYSDISTGVIIPENDYILTNEIEIFTLEGTRVYKGAIDGNIQLKSDIYIIRRDNKTIKTFIR